MYIDISKSIDLSSSFFEGMISLIIDLLEFSNIRRNKINKENT